MALNFNVDPYYDDFDPTKNFYRVLFKPGVAVQARELTQSQTILQDQVSKFGLGVFNDGSKVTGANITVDANIITCKLTSDIATTISSLVGLYAVGQTSNFISKVSSVDSTNFYIKTKPVNIANGKAFSSGETINFYTSKVAALSSLNTTIAPAYAATAKTEGTLTRTVSATYLNNNLTITTGGISVGDSINIPSINFNAIVTSIVDITTLVMNNTIPQTVSNVSATITNKISVSALEVNIDDGVWFTNGLFVANYADSIVPDALNVYPSVVVGFEVDESHVDSYSDPSLLDPAIGASNYQAPGADRYKVSLRLVTKPYINNQVVTSLTSAKFIELVRINAGILENINNTPTFSDISAAIATAVSDTSGDFIVNPFSLMIGDTTSTANNLSASISAGKAYIGGYPVQHISQTPYLLEKARDTSYLFNQDIETYYGNYTTVKNLNGSIINFSTSPTVELHNVEFGAASAGTKIGTARIRNFSYDSGTLANAEYKSFLFDIKLTTLEPFTNVASFILPNDGNYTAPTFSANTVSPVTLVDNTYNSLIFPLPQKNTSNVSSVNYVTTRKYTVPTFASGIAAITTGGTNEIFQGGSGVISSSAAKQNFIVVTTSASGNYPSGAFIPMDQANVSITITNSPGTPQASLNIAGNFSGSADIYAVISVTSDLQQTKLLHTNQAVEVSANTTGTSIDLSYSDVYKFSGVYELGNTHPYQGSYASGSSYSLDDAIVYDDGAVYISLINSNTGHTPNTSPSQWSAVTNSSGSYTLDNGQRDSIYDHGTITNNTGVSKGSVVVVFDYFTHSGGTGYFSVGSYPVPYADIPSFTSPQYGTTYPLRDVLDFRPSRTDSDTTFDSNQIPAPFQNVFVNYGYYLSRIDKVVLYPNGQFKTVRGISSYLNPVAPSDIPGTLTLFTNFYPAFTYSKDTVQVTPTNLRRYTMRDIGVLDKRITNIEYYTSLSLLESQVTGQDVTDATGLNLLFKNGYLVDAFNGSSVADVQNYDLAASIDPVAQLARPLYFSNVATYHVDTTQGTFVVSPGNKTNNQLSLKDNLITYSYNEYPFITQTVATELINVNPFNVVGFVGSVNLSPSSDVWYSTETQPNVNIVTDDQAAWTAATNGTGNGTQYNDWQLNWTGQPTDTVITSSDQTSITRDTIAITNSIKNQGLTSALTGGPIQVSSSTQVLSTAVIPFARSIPVHFEIEGMAPLTKLHTFLDGMCVDSYVQPDIGSCDSLNYITISDAGTGYADGDEQSIIVITGNNNTQAVATANVSAGQIVAVNIKQTGSGYTAIPTITVTGANTHQAVLTSNGASYLGGQLTSNINGFVSGIITIPNDNVIQLPTGVISVEFGDNLLSPTVGKAYAKGIFYAQGTLQTVQSTVISTRPPNVTPKPQVINNITNTTVVSQISNPPAITTPATPTTPATTTPVYGNDALNPGSSNYAVDGYAATVYADVVASSLLKSPVPYSVAKEDLPKIDAVITSAQKGNPPTGTETLAAIQYIVNRINNDAVTFDEALADLNVICVNNAGKLQDLATSYVTDSSNAGAYQAAHAAADAAVNAIGGPSALCGTDPLSQNFFVDPNKYPNGLFLSSVSLYFATKDSTIPVSVRIRNTVNGFPDAVTDIPGSIVFKNPVDVNIPTGDTQAVLGPATVFTFRHPIYLPPGQFTILVAAETDEYTMYASKLGQVQYGTAETVNSITYAGSLFKSQNASTWVPAPSETLCFILNICDFAGGSTTFNVTSNTSPSIIDFDTLQLTSTDLTFNSLDSINYNVITKDKNTSSTIGPTSVLTGRNHNFATRQVQSSSGDLIIQPTVNNIDRWTSPVLDLERLNTILVKNIITPYYSANTISESAGGFGNGGGSARYITRRVTLNNNFASTGLTVFVDVNRPPGTSIEVYYKVLNQNDPNNFDLNQYTKMNPVFTPGIGLGATGISDYVSDTYQALNISYNDIVTGTTYNTFNVFAIKIVMYADNPAIAPQIKNFRAIATA